MKNMKMFIAVMVGIGVMFSGCAYIQGTKVPDKTFTSFKIGKTTKKEVVAALGGPQDLKIDGGKQILTYKYQQIGDGFTSGNESSDTIFIFNDKGILEDLMKGGGSLPNPLTGK
jgi:hypothetical protein